MAWLLLLLLLPAQPAGAEQAFPTPVPRATSFRSQAQARVEEGRALMKQGQQQEALDSFYTAVRIDPAYWEAYEALGDAYRALNKTYQAIESYERAVAIINPTWAKDNVRQARISVQRKNFSAAFDNYKTILGIKPEAGRLLNQGVAMVEAGDVDGARKIFLKAIEADPDYADAHYKLGNVYYAKKKWDDAINSYKLAQKYAPKDPAIPYKIGNSYFRKGDVKAAIAPYRQAVVLKGSDPDYRVNLGVALYETKDYQGALQQFQTARFLSPRDTQTLLYLGNAQARLKKYDEAIETYQEVLKIDPKERRAYYNLGFAYVQKAEIRPDPNSIGKYIDDTTKDQYYIMGTKYYPLDMYRRAGEYLTRYVALAPKDEDVQEVQAMIAKLKELAARPQQ